MWHSAQVDINIPEMAAIMRENRSQCAAETSVHADHVNGFSRSSLYGVLHTEQHAGPFAAARCKKIVVS